MSNNIENKVIVITGASSGLGEAAARFLFGRGRDHRARCTAAYPHQGPVGDVGACWRQSALAMTTDVTDCAQVKRLVDAAVQTFGRVDVMINNAGLMPQAPLEILKVDSSRSLGEFRASRTSSKLLPFPAPLRK